MYLHSSHCNIFLHLHNFLLLFVFKHLFPTSLLGNFSTAFDPSNDSLWCMGGGREAGLNVDTETVILFNYVLGRSSAAVTLWEQAVTQKNTQYELIMVNI